MDYSDAGRPRDIEANSAVLDADGLAAFVETNYQRLIGLAGLVCRGAVEPADVVQSALEQAWRHRADLREAGRLRPWLDRILVRQALHLRRRRFRFPTTSPRGEGRELELAARPGVEPAEWAGLRVAFDGLSREQRAAVALHLYAGYTVEETAVMTGAGIETTRSRLRLARQRLRDQMSENKV